MKKSIFILLFLCLVVFLTTAHPHMFFRNSYEFVINDGRIVGTWIEWEFDAYFTNQIRMDYDTNRDGSFSTNEIQSIYDGAFINLGNYNYFQSVRQGTHRFEVTETEEFTAFLKDNVMYYRFYIDLSFLRPSDFYIATYDPTFFCSIDFYKDSAVKINGDGPFNFKLEENTDTPVYYDPKGAANYSPVYQEWAPGLETYVPVEVHVIYE